MACEPAAPEAEEKPLHNCRKLKGCEAPQCGQDGRLPG
jgi:hypothetical protein